MRKVKWLLAAGLLATTVACTAETSPYGSSYGYPSTAYNNNGYYSNTTAYNRGYYAPAPAPGYCAPSSGYVASTPQRGPNGDYDRDGIPNKYDRDANGDGVPDRYQR